MKTHNVIDLVYHEDEGNEVFVGTLDECTTWMVDQSGVGCYNIIPLSRYELKIHNNENVES